MVGVEQPSTKGKPLPLVQLKWPGISASLKGLQNQIYLSEHCEKEVTRINGIGHSSPPPSCSQSLFFPPNHFLLRQHLKAISVKIYCNGETRYHDDCIYKSSSSLRVMQAIQSLGPSQFGYSKVSCHKRWMMPLLINGALRSSVSTLLTTKGAALHTAVVYFLCKFHFLAFSVLLSDCLS